MDIVERLREWNVDPSGMEEAANEIERLRGIINDDRLEGAADEIERLRQLVKELNSVAYVIDGHGVAHHSFTIVYKELE